MRPTHAHRLQSSSNFREFFLLSFGLHVATIWLLSVIALLLGTIQTQDFKFLGLYFLAALFSGPIFALGFSESAILLAFAFTTISNRILGRTPLWLLGFMLPICSFAYWAQWSAWLWLFEGTQGPLLLSSRGFFMATAINAPVLLGSWHLNVRRSQRHFARTK
jgi:hypothetical protein